MSCWEGPKKPPLFVNGDFRQFIEPSIDTAINARLFAQLTTIFIYKCVLPPYTTHIQVLGETKCATNKGIQRIINMESVKIVTKRVGIGHRTMIKSILVIILLGLISAQTGYAVYLYNEVIERNVQIEEMIAQTEVLQKELQKSNQAYDDAMRQYKNAQSRFAQERNERDWQSYMSSQNEYSEPAYTFEKKPATLESLHFDENNDYQKDYHNELPERLPIQVIPTQVTPIIAAQNGQVTYPEIKSLVDNIDSQIRSFPEEAVIEIDIGQDTTKPDQFFVIRKINGIIYVVEQDISTPEVELRITPWMIHNFNKGAFCQQQGNQWWLQNTGQSPLKLIKYASWINIC